MSDEPRKNYEVNVELAHVEEFVVAAHKEVVVCEGEGLAGNGGVVGDGGNGGHGEGVEIEDDGAKEVVDEEHTVLHGLGPDKVIAIGEEFVVCGGDEGGEGGGFVADAVEGKLDEGRSKTEKTTTTTTNVLQVLLLLFS
ncbi:hypothetical protein SESBI_39635 [Sesbania bispinosa]|nr:hypothetical protein SESBI_39635 [Sesbania bispinosa]